MSQPTDNTMQQQQAAQRAEAMRQAQKSAKPQSNASVKFAEVLKAQQKPTTGSKLLKNNPVGGAEVVKSALKGGSNKGQSKLAIAANASGGGTTSGSTSGSTSGAGGTASSASSATDASITASYKLMEMNQDFNLQYLNLQESMQAESRQYTAMSNVSKTKTDTAKNSLSNVK